MTVATKIQPNYTTQTAAAYKGAIDGMLSVMDRIGGPFAAHELDIGSPAPDLAIRVDGGPLFISGTLYEVAAQTVTGFTVPASGYNRVDRIVLNPSTGAVSRVAGTAVLGSPSGSAPTIPAGYLPICRVTLTSSTPVITNDMIVDERVPFQISGMVQLTYGTAFPVANFVIISNIPQTFKRLVLAIANMSFDTSSRRLYVYHNAVTSGYGGFLITSSGTEYLTATGAVLGPTVAAATLTNALVEITNYTLNTNTCFKFNSVTTGGTNPSGGMCTLLNNTTAMTSLTLAMDSTGNFDGGTYDLWGEF